MGIASLGWVGQQTIVSVKLYLILSLADNGSPELLLTLVTVSFVFFNLLGNSVGAYLSLQGLMPSIPSCPNILGQNHFAEPNQHVLNTDGVALTQIPIIEFNNFSSVIFNV